MIYDCFIFFNELELLEIRLHELDAVVDLFVLVEGDRTFTGKPKPLYFADNRHLFQPYLHKIVHVCVLGDAWPASGNAWAKERHQRNSIVRALHGCRDDDIVMISDCDEIPRAATVKTFDPTRGYRRCKQSHHYYYLNTRGGDWFGTVILTAGELSTLGSAEAARALRTRPGCSLSPGGWHFSYLGGPERIRHKLESFSHVEYDREPIKDVRWIESRIRDGRDLFGRPRPGFDIVPLDESYPAYLLANRSKFRSLIREPSLDAEEPSPPLRPG